MAERKFSDKEWAEIHAEERRVLAKIADKNLRRQKAILAGGPEVGIFWLLPNGKILMDGTPVTEAASYGDLKIHEGTHTSMWNTFQRNGIVPADVDYDEYPRGRVAYNGKTRTFHLFADACILKDKAVVNKIKNDFRLPSNTKTGRDEHYKCPGCVKRNKKREEEDWDI